VYIGVESFEQIQVFKNTIKDNESYDELVHVLRYTPRTNERKYVETARLKAFTKVLDKFPKFTYLRVQPMNDRLEAWNMSRAEVQRYVGELHG